MQPNLTDQNKGRLVNIEVDEALARDLIWMSQRTGQSIRNLLAALVWIGKKAFGRKLTVQSKEEAKVLEVHLFEELEKVTSLDKD